MKVMVVYHTHSSDIFIPRFEKSIRDQLTWALEKKIIEDILFVQTKNREDAVMINFVDKIDITAMIKGRDIVLANEKIL